MRLIETHDTLTLVNGEGTPVAKTALEGLIVLSVFGAGALGQATVGALLGWPVALIAAALLLGLGRLWLRRTHVTFGVDRRLGRVTIEQRSLFRTHVEDLQLADVARVDIETRSEHRNALRVTLRDGRRIMLGPAGFKHVVSEQFVAGLGVGVDSHPARA